MPSCDILIRTYWRDFSWLEYCLRAVERHCVGFRVVVVVVPEKSLAWLERHRPLPSFARLEVCEDYDDDYLGQQVTKLYADCLTDADLICHLDSDCMFARLTRPDDLAPGGRPRIYTRPITELPREWPWTRPTEEFLGWRPTHDFMQCPPFVYPGWLHRELREWSRRVNGVSLSDWILSQPPRGFSEFNVLGAYAYAYHRDAFIWTRARDLGEEEATCHWYWSWGGLDASTVDELESLVYEASDAENG